MHIGFLCNEYPPGQHGGVGTFTQTLARSLVGSGHQVTVLGIYQHHPSGTSDDQGVRVIRLPHTPLPGSGLFVHGARLRQALATVQRQTPFDVLEGPEVSLAALPARFPATRVIRMHGGHNFFAATLGHPVSPWRNWLERRSFRRADRLCAVSHFVADTTRQLLNLGERPIEILPNSVDTEYFAPQPAVTETPGLILFVGTICEKKGIRQLVQAMPQIVSAVPQAQLWVVGRDWPDEKTGQSFTERLRQMIPPELHEHVQFKGPLPHAELPGLLARAAVCVYPSHMEALPLAWLEGLAMGKALVVSQTGPGPEVVEEGISGLLCDPYDPGSIARQVIRLLTEPAFAQRLGIAARLRALQHFSVPALTTRNELFYAACASARQLNPGRVPRLANN